jgi:molybdopterin molybdotransferase
MNKNSKPPMLSAKEALASLLSAAKPLVDIETIATIDATGRVLAEHLKSQLNVPTMDNTQMDGYAVRASDCASGSARLRVSQRIPAGHVGQPLEAGTAARIFTGALIPDGADTVVMQSGRVIVPAVTRSYASRSAYRPDMWGSH